MRLVGTGPGPISAAFRSALPLGPGHRGRFAHCGPPPPSRQPLLSGASQGPRQPLPLQAHLPLASLEKPLVRRAPCCASRTRRGSSSEHCTFRTVLSRTNMLTSALCPSPVAFPRGLAVVTSSLLTLSLQYEIPDRSLPHPLILFSLTGKFCD